LGTEDGWIINDGWMTDDPRLDDDDRCSITVLGYDYLYSIVVD
jgi:hypothetical protein